MRGRVTKNVIKKTYAENLHRRKKHAQSRNRTSDTRIFSPLLYQLSYLGMSSGNRI